MKRLALIGLVLAFPAHAQYLDGLPAASSVTGTDVIPVCQGGTVGVPGTCTTRKGTVSQIQSSVASATPVAASGTSTTNTLGVWTSYLAGVANPNIVIQNGSALGVASAACNGVTNDTGSFSTALSAYKQITLPPGKTCLVNSLVLTSNQTLDCQGSTLQPYSATGWIVKKTGFHAVTRNCVFNDASSYTEQATTLSAGASSGATTISVDSAAGMGVGEPVSILLASGASWVTKITGISGTIITLQDAIPYSATAIASIGTGGSGYNAGDALVVQGGMGPPITLSAAVTTGALNGSTTIAAPGLYSTAPSNPAVVYDGQNGSATGATVNITYAGASSGAAVEASWGALAMDQATEGETTNITFSSVPAAFGIYNTGASSATWTAGERVSGIYVNAAKLFGIFRDVGVSNITVDRGVIYGTTHGASSYGGAGIYLNAEGVGAAPPGGNHFTNVNVLNWETGYQDNSGQLDFFDAGVTSDTIRNYAFACNGCTSNTFTGTPWLAFTGPSAITGTAGYGIGLYAGNTAINNSFAGLATSNNAADVHIADAASTLWIAPPWSSSKKLSGIGSALQTSAAMFSATSPSSVGGSGTTVYLGGAGYSTTEALAETLNATKGVINSFTCASGAAPGAGQSYTCNLRVNEVTRASCVWSGTSAYSCTYAGPGVGAFLLDRVDTAIVSSASAVATQFRSFVTQQ